MRHLSALPPQMRGKFFGHGTPTLTAPQVRRLAEKVRRRLSSIGDPAVRAPSPGDYLAERHYSPCNDFDLAVDIDIGSTVLSLRAGANWPNKPKLGPGTDLDAISKVILETVLLARDNHIGLARLEATEKVVRTRIRREGMGLKLISVRFSPASINRPESTRELGTWVRVGLLDDLLLPDTRLITEQGNRGIFRQLKRHDDDQTRRRQALERLASQDAVLEIEAMAEHAIAIAGRTIGDIVRTMFERRQQGVRQNPKVTLWGDRAAEHVSVVANGGCIQLEAKLGDFGCSWHHGILVDRVFPETITMALVGRPLRALIEHPFLKGNAEIAEAVRCGDSWTEIKVKADARPISREEVGDLA